MSCNDLSSAREHVEQQRGFRRCVVGERGAAGRPERAQHRFAAHRGQMLDTAQRRLQRLEARNDQGTYGAVAAEQLDRTLDEWVEMRARGAELAFEVEFGRLFGEELDIEREPR